MKFSTGVLVLGGLVLANADCIPDCESTAASSLGCDVSDLSGCFCLDDFATAAKACLYQNSDCGKTYVAEFYESVNSACASVSATSDAGAATTTSAAAAATSAASGDCVATCESTAASSLGCDASDLAGCFCLADFATQAKACLYSSGCNSDVSTFYEAYNSACADVSVSSAAATSAAVTSAAATSGTAATTAPATTLTATTAAVTSVATASSVVASNGTATATSVVTAGANAYGAPFGVAALAACAGVAALY
ncbi:hypothetical protein NKR23_g9119 [Pleurostoma richardsiae]|uniref:CFEM domain-containing protein n=1 Tax=Pleurostoma richardsiae TaxID=41990 RepID=A0AA38VKH9_9PEZI|nr:hypothetical protein NKR23_g9119 [Pleurostoma richardsiae]